MDTPLFPVVLVQYSRCRSNSPKSSRFVYSHDCVSTQALNCCGVLSGPPGTSILRRSPVRCPSRVPSAITVHWPSPITSHPSTFLPLKSGFQSAAPTLKQVKASTKIVFTILSIRPLKRFRTVCQSSQNHWRLNCNTRGRRTVMKHSVALPICFGMVIAAFGQDFPDRRDSRDRDLRDNYADTIP